MKIAVPLVGTRGDVQPILALALELQRRGHRIQFGAPPNLVDFVGNTGISARPCGPDVQQLYSSAAGQKALAAGSTFRLMQMVGQQMTEYVDRLNHDVIDVCDGADLIVSSLVTEDRASSMAEALGVPMVSVHYYPCRYNTAYPFPGALPPSWESPGLVNGASWVLAENLRRVVFMRYLNDFRRLLDLPKSYASTAAVLAERKVPELQIYDSALVPNLPAQWDDRRPFTGFLQLQHDAREAIGDLSGDHDAILSWIAEGEPPVFFGFGSMPISDAPGVLAMVKRVSSRLGVRALVSAGWSGLESEDDVDVRVAGPFAFDIVLPHCIAAVHHGGAGTLFEGLRAGLPTLVCSVSFEQPMWGGQVERLGVGKHLKFTQLTADRLEDGVRALLEPARRDRARKFASTLVVDGATAHAADVVEAAAR